MRRKLGVTLLTKNLVEKLTGDTGYYYLSCEIKMQPGEFTPLVKNLDIHWKIDASDLNFLDQAYINLVRESEYHNPGAFEIWQIKDDIINKENLDG